jgi:hypothetical protein
MDDVLVFRLDYNGTDEYGVVVAGHGHRKAVVGEEVWTEDFEGHGCPGRVVYVSDIVTRIKLDFAGWKVLG